ncbi:hypothetical protein OFP68_14050 [Brachyspira hyodysenteriae]|uniref:hypothetical protein n=1 Tax=Brachyspira hyodysenteriae TaxID=159 RepID=UPI0022CD4B40|nr:hypothetical protein [Brachyspira hyodysenteriae]MCZ9879995.1 hypothetical protein [Brachyspira hyodysenteriae]
MVEILFVSPNCKFEFIYNQPNFEEIKSIYSNDYYKAWSMEDGENNESSIDEKLILC